MSHITFIHGIANKPPQGELLKFWRNALARDSGINLGAHGISSSMVYWADVMYATPLDEETSYESEAVPSPDLGAAAQEPGVDPAWKSELSDDERLWLKQLEMKVKFEAVADNLGTAAEGALEEEGAGPEGESPESEYERIWLPAAVKKKLMELFLRDVHHYLFNATNSPRAGSTFRVQDEIRRRMLKALEEDAGKNKTGPHVIVSHSMGTVISYDCLMRVPGCPRVDALVTIGSPLGLDEIQDALKPQHTTRDGFPSANVSKSWVNVFDRLDPVAGLDPELANDYQRGGELVIEDIHEPNWGPWRHDITKYLRGAKLRAKLKQLLQV